MIVDTSALIAILTGEPEREDFVDALLQAPSAAASAATYLETAIVVDRIADPILSRRLDDLIESLGIAVVDVTAVHARLARSAYRDYGGGSGHAAKLNFGDCFVYALAASMDEPLLFKGDDFVHTDLRSVL